MIEADPSAHADREEAVKAAGAIVNQSKSFVLPLKAEPDVGDWRRMGKVRGRDDTLYHCGFPLTITGDKAAMAHWESKLAQFQ
jgi:hypothetical protein